MSLAKSLTLSPSNRRRLRSSNFFLITVNHRIMNTTTATSMAMPTPIPAEAFAFSVQVPESFVNPLLHMQMPSPLSKSMLQDPCPLQTALEVEEEKQLSGMQNPEVSSLRELSPEQRHSAPFSVTAQLPCKPQTLMTPSRW